MSTAFHTVPREGLAHPAFETLPEGDELMAVWLFDGAIDRATFEKVDKAWDAWMASTEWSRFGAAEPEMPMGNINSRFALVRLGKVRHPREPIAALEKAIRDQGVAIRECRFARWTVIEDELMRPIAETEEHPYNDLEELLRAAFDPHAPKPDSESDYDCKGLWQDGEKVVAELRGHRLQVPGVRLCYGIADNPGPEEAVREIEADARTEAVEKALAEALPRAVGGGNEIAPPKGRERVPGFIDTIVWNGRRGYQMSWLANELALFFGSHFLLREYEVVQALGEVIHRLELEPVITWRRHGKPVSGTRFRQPSKLFFQLWEKPGLTAPAVAPRALKRLDSPEVFFEDFLGEVDREPKRRHPRNDLETLETYHGARFAPDLRAFLGARDRVTLNNRGFGNRRSPSAWLLDDPDIFVPDPAKGNLFEQLLAASPLQLYSFFTGAVPVGYSGGSNLDYLANAHSKADDDKTHVITYFPRNHTCNVIADGLASLAFMNHLLVNEEARAAGHAEKLKGRVHPNRDYSALSDDLEIVDGAESGCGSRFYRSFYLLQLLGRLWAPSMEVIAENAAESKAPPFDKMVASGSLAKPTTGLMYLWDSFFRKDEARLTKTLEVCSASSSPVSRDAAAVVREVVAGRKALGPVEDLHARREEFLAAMAVRTS
jgi:hypothetical protein